MCKLKILAHSLLLTTTPSLIAQPQTPHVSVHVQTVHSEKQNFQLDEKLLSYDQILHLLDELESGELEEKCTEEELEKINQFIARLAEEGFLPGENRSTLDNDITGLFKQEDGLYEFAYALDDEYYLPSYNHQEILLCKSWVKKNWEKTKKFVKDHKKESSLVLLL